jgi:hypothetical protein
VLLVRLKFVFELPTDFGGEILSSAGKWDSLYRNISVKNRDTHPIKFGDGITYRIAAAFLSDVPQVEDWGCGTGAFKEFCLVDYLGVDGSKSPYVDRIADLTKYRSKTAAVHIRHVLEHNYDWEVILANAVASTEQKLCLCLFTPFAPSTVEIATNTDINVPVLSLPRAQIERHFEGLSWRLLESIPTNTEYRQEHVYLVWKHPDAIRDQMEVELRQTKLALLAMARERDLWMSASPASRAVATPQPKARTKPPATPFRKLVKKYVKKPIRRCRKFVLGR